MQFSQISFIRVAYIGDRKRLSGLRSQLIVTVLSDLFQKWRKSVMCLCKYGSYAAQFSFNLVSQGLIGVAG